MKAKSLACILSLFFAVANFFTLSAENVPPCFNQLHVNFFRPELVSQALSMNKQIYQSSWFPITTDLRNAAYQVPVIARQIARTKNPNPLDPFDREGAAIVLQQAFLQVTAGVLQKYNVTNLNTANNIVRFLWQNNPDVQQCFR